MKTGILPVEEFILDCVELAETTTLQRILVIRSNKPAGKGIAGLNILNKIRKECVGRMGQYLEEHILLRIFDARSLLQKFVLPDVVLKEIECKKMNNEKCLNKAHEGYDPILGHLQRKKRQEIVLEDLSSDFDRLQSYKSCFQELVKTGVRYAQF